MFLYKKNKSKQKSSVLFGKPNKSWFYIHIAEYNTVLTGLMH